MQRTDEWKHKRKLEEEKKQLHPTSIHRKWTEGVHFKERSLYLVRSWSGRPCALPTEARGGARAGARSGAGPGAGATSTPAAATRSAASAAWTAQVSEVDLQLGRDVIGWLAEVMHVLCLGKEKTGG